MRILNPEIYARQKERILKIASSLFARRGYKETSMDIIACACRMKKPSLYHYFKSKQALLRTLIQCRTKHPQKILPSMLTGDMEENLYQLGMQFLQEMEVKSNREFFQILFRDSTYDPYVRKVFLSGLKEKNNQLCGAFSPSTTGPDEKAFFMGIHQFMGSLVRYAVETRMWDLGQSTQFSDEEYLRSLARIFALGIKDLVPSRGSGGCRPA
jgi:AcrR family transcriptional regulator